MVNKENQLHVVTEGNAWKVDKSHINEHPSKFTTQQRAIEEAIRLAKNKQGMEIVIHESDSENMDANPLMFKKVSKYKNIFYINFFLFFYTIFYHFSLPIKNLN